MEKLILNFTLLIALIAGFQKANAQDAFSMSTTYMQDGAPKAASKGIQYADMEGSPYLYDGWAKGVALLSDGKAYKGLYLKYNEIEGTVIFKYALTDSAMMFAIPAVEFIFSYITNDQEHTAHFLSGFKPVNDGNGNTFYQVLDNGKTKLLKKTVKKIVQNKEFNSSTTTRKVDENTSYYLAKDKQPVRIKNDNKSVLAALSDKADKLKQYMADNKLNVRDDEDFAKVVNYYNTL
jgi:hypothetical protein